MSKGPSLPPRPNGIYWVLLAIGVAAFAGIAAIFLWGFRHP